MEIERIGVIGAGQMGNGIAHVMALAGYEVLLNDVNQDALDRAISLIDRNLERQVTREVISAEAKAEAIARITPTLTLTDLGRTDLVIEAATERETVKDAIFRELVPHLQDHTILTSNTTSISITRLASRTDRPERFMGFHFMNPVPVMQLVELIRGIATDEATYKACHGIVERIGKTAASAEDFPAFIVNRILMPMINEAVYTLYEGVGNVNSIDQAMKLGANHPMGPLELADFIGLDTCLAIMNVLHDGLADTKYRPCPLLTKYVEAGWLGRKTGRGFYDYSGDKPVPTRCSPPSSGPVSSGGPGGPPPPPTPGPGAMPGPGVAGATGRARRHHLRISNPSQGSAGAASDCTSRTSAAPGPCQQAVTISSSALRAPQTIAVTEPSSSFRTQPRRPSLSAWPFVQARKATPWTRPVTLRWRHSSVMISPRGDVTRPPRPSDRPAPRRPS